MEKFETINAKINTIKTVSYSDQNPGTSGLRKKVKVFMQENYLHNFVQSIFSAHKSEDYNNKSLIVGGDGRFYNEEAIDIIVKIAFANNINTIYIPESGVLSTPCVSALIRKTENCFGGIILSASHNPGGINEDFGIKFNSSNGAPSSELITNKMFEITKSISSYQILDVKDNMFKKQVNIDLDGDVKKLRFIDTTKDYIELLKNQFDFDQISKLFKMKGFSFVFDAMHGASGPYAIELFKNIFGISESCLLNCNVLPDFGGHHPDPNLVHADQLVKMLNINKNNNDGEKYQFGAACDGDADRNMILGWECFVSPSDSLAVIAANCHRIKAFKEKGLLGTARSMPTSKALDRVAKKKNIPCYEVPTGWKFFGNLMDAGKINLCGEESFGTSSDHIREKDGIWAIMCWLSILSDYNKDYDSFKVTVQDIMNLHWKEFGRDYYCRYDYENLDNEQTNKIIESLNNSFNELNSNGHKAYIFNYKDPVDNSESKNQGWIIELKSGERIIFRKSGTSSSGATIRIYFEKYEEKQLNLPVDEAIKEIVDIALKFSEIQKISGRNSPCVIT